MTHARTKLTCALLALAAFAASVAPAPAAGATLTSRIDGLVRSSSVAGSTSVYVFDDTTRQVLYARQASRRVSPASTMKLLTSAAALARFGEEHVFTTRVALTGNAQDSTWVGDVYLVGGGDPSLSTAGFSRDNLGGDGTDIADLVAPLIDRGITRIEGRLVVVDDLLDQQRYVRDWPASFRYVETGALGALTVNEAQLGRWIGGRSSRAPDLHAGALYRAALAREDVTVTGATVAGSLPTTAEIAGEATSEPLPVLLEHLMWTSDNFYAEVLLKDIGADRYGSGGGTTAHGRRAARLELERIGVDTTSLRWVDGSGLAYANGFDVRMLGRVLGIGAQSPWGATWIDSLARSGRGPSTIQNRMTTWPFRDRVHAKTGTLRHVSALAGFADQLGVPGQRYGFVVISFNTSGATMNFRSARSLQDDIAKALVR